MGMVGYRQSRKAAGGSAPSNISRTRPPPKRGTESQDNNADEVEIAVDRSHRALDREDEGARNIRRKEQLVRAGRRQQMF